VVGEGAAGRQALFNNNTPLYDTLNDVLSLGQHRVWKQATVHWSSAFAGGAALARGPGARRAAHGTAEAGAMLAGARPAAGAVFAHLP
jgi:ubiquinone/menaquinone biosynthesis C-methylase UbiE